MAARKGTIQWKDGCWQARVWMPSAEVLPDGKPQLVRRWYKLEGVPEDARDVAKEAAAHLQAEIEQRGYVPAERDLTVNEYFRKRWLPARKRKVASWKNDLSYFDNHIGKELGQLPIRAVTRDRLTDFVRTLDKNVTAGEYSAKTAANIWACVMAIFRDASRNKDRSLLVLESNPADGVPRPDDAEDGDRQKQMLYPDEFVALISCEAVPLSRRRLYAFALLTQTRQAEIRAMTWTDVDVEHRRIDVTKSEDTIRGGGLKATKSKRVRDVTVEETLVPMLLAMREESGKGKLFPDMPRADGEYGLAGLFRSDLKVAGITRASLHEPTQTSMPIRFHDLRASGITWRLARGDNPLVVRQETGHADAEVQQIYVRKLRELGGTQLFPALPQALLGGCLGTVPVSRIPSQIRGKFVGATGFEAISPGCELTRNEPEERGAASASAPVGDDSRGTVQNADDLIRAAMKACVDEGRLDDLSRLTAILSGRSAAPTAKPNPSANVVPIHKPRRTK